MRIALVHDYLSQYGGAERVLEIIHGRYPDAPVVTAVLDRGELPRAFDGMEISASWLERVPGSGRHHRLLFPLYPLVFDTMGRQLRDYDVVLADSSAWAHHVSLDPEQVLVCYCHSPARFLYGDQDYLARSSLPGMARHVLPAISAGFRAIDRRAAARVDRYVANSLNVSRRIRRAYGREARVIYPPVDLARFSMDPPAAEPEPWFLVLSRLVPHKRIDIAIAACTRAGIPLKIIGDGRARGELERVAGPSVEFLGQLTDAEVADHLKRCRALILPAAEDFGMTAIEAQAAGRPVVAYGKGGALESVISGETGVFFPELSPSSLLAAIDVFGRVTWKPSIAIANARRFSAERFVRELDQEIAAAMEAKRIASGGSFSGGARSAAAKP